MFQGQKVSRRLCHGCRCCHGLGSVMNVCPVLNVSCHHCRFCLACSLQGFPFSGAFFFFFGLGAFFFFGLLQRVVWLLIHTHVFFPQNLCSSNLETDGCWILNHCCCCFLFLFFGFCFVNSHLTTIFWCK